MICDKCGEKMNLMPWVFCSMPPQYAYECPACGAHKNARIGGLESNGKIYAILKEEESGDILV